MSDIDPMITIAARMDEMRAKLAEHELLFGVALHTDDFLQGLLAGLAHQLPPETPRTVEGIVDAVANMALKLDAHEDASTPAFDEIAKLCGCPEWEYPGQVVRDVEKVVKERDEALGEISRMTLRPAAEIIEAERKRMARLDEMQAERDFWRSQTNALTPAYIKLQDQLRIAEAVRDDARAASQRYLDEKREAEALLANEREKTCVTLRNAVQSGEWVP